MYIGQMRAAGRAKESALGTPVTTPTEYVAYQPPLGFHPTAHELLSMAVASKADRIRKAAPGPIDADNLKMKYEAGPENIGNALLATFGQDSKTGALATGYSHVFKRANVAQLPSFSLWADRGVDFPILYGAMMSKLDIDIKAKEFVTFDEDWKALGFQAGSSKSPSFSTYNPFVFNQAVVTVAGSPINDYSSLKLSFDNFIKADHVLNNSRYPGKIYSEGFEATVDLDLVVEDTTEYAKYLAGGSTSIQVVMTHPDDITGADAGTKPMLTIILPEVYYTAAPFPNTQGLLAVKMTGKAVYNASAGYTAQATLKNSVSTAY